MLFESHETIFRNRAAQTLFAQYRDNYVQTQTLEWGAHAATSIASPASPRFNCFHLQTNQFIGSDGRSRELDHVFYTTRVHELWSATIQEVWAPNIEQLLMNRTLRLRVWCTNDETAEWLFLRVGSDSLDCSDVSGLCEVSQNGKLHAPGSTVENTARYTDIWGGSRP